MEYFIGGLIAWIIISWIFLILSEMGCIDVFLKEDKPLWFLFAPMWILLIVIVLPTIFGCIFKKFTHKFKKFKNKK